jgi:hypothetical protein
MSAPGRADLPSQERWRRIEGLFHAAVALEGDSRRAYLESACADDILRLEVESLILSIEETGASSVLTGVLGRAARQFLELPEGERLGAYQIVRKIGAGGMGIVYLASRADDQFRKNVAIKFLEGPARDGVSARFRLERQILAGLEHPNIARLLDGGDFEGTPYLVMEFVDGIPLDEYVRRWNPPISERLRLFGLICDAVSFAHRQLVVHRDIKPANILVTADGVPKLLDFGIAKIMASDPACAGVTRPTERLMTPEYASPEQVRGDSVTTATDVYSLGVVLYELLAGRRPFVINPTRPLDAAHTICEQEPAKPSAAAQGKLRRDLRGDLDTIVLMAIRKEPSRRYSSAEHLAEDIRRHLDGYPVKARRDTALYRAGKFLRRHQVASVVAAVALVLLSATLVRLAAERQRAQAGFTEVREMANGFLFEFEGAIRNLPGSTAARRLVVARALDYLARLEKTGAGDPTFERELADAYTKVGNIQFEDKPPSLYDPEGARESVLKEIPIRERLARTGKRPDGARLASAWFKLSILENLLLHTDASETARRRALSLADMLTKEDASDPDVADALISRQLALMEESPNMDKKLAHGREAVALADAVVDRGPAGLLARRRAVFTRFSVIKLLTSSGHIPSDALAIRLSAQNLVAALLRDAPKDVDVRGLANRVNETICGSANSAPAEALAACRQIVAVLQPVVAADPEDLSSYLSLSATYGLIGQRLREAGTLEQAVPEFEQALIMTQAAWRLRPRDPDIRRHFAEVSVDVANFLVELGKPGPARDRLRGIAPVIDSIRAETSRRPQENLRVINILTELGDTEMSLGEARAAQESFQGALTEFARLSPAVASPPGFSLTPAIVSGKLKAATVAPAR